MGCPLCGEFTHKASTRLIQDSCGHVKCRLCLLKEENGCRICEAESRINPIGSFNYPLPASRSPDYEFPNCVPLELTINKIPDNLELNSLPQSVGKQITINENNLENLQGWSNNVPIETNENVQRSQVNSIAENQNIHNQSASIPQILEIENTNSNDSNDSHDLSDETTLVIDEEREEIIKDSQDNNLSNPPAFHNKNEANENQVLYQVNSPNSSCPKENWNQIAKRKNVGTPSSFQCGVSVIQKNLSSIGSLSKLEKSKKSNSDLPNKIPKHLSNTSQEPKLDLAGIPYKSPVIQLSDHVTLNERNEKKDASPLSVNYKSPNFRLSDYLVFKNRSSQDEVTQKIEKDLNEAKKRSGDYVTTDGFSVQKIPASNQNLIIQTEDDLQNNALNEKDTAINKSSTVLDMSSYPILKKRFMLNSSVMCNKQQSQNVKRDYEGTTDSLSPNQERSKNEKKTGDEENKENKKKLKEKEKLMKKSTKVRSYARATALKKHIVSSKSNKYKNVNSLKMKSNKRKKKEENLKKNDEPIATRKGERKRKRKVLIYENEVLEVLTKKRRRRSTSPKSDSSPSRSASPGRSPESKRCKSKKDWSHVVRLPGTPARYRCTVCDVSFGHWRGRSAHAACRSGEPPFRCNTCDRSFYKRSHFEYHERVHTGEKPYTCHLCSKGFVQKNKLNRHLTTHKQQNDIECDICKKTFNSKEYLKNHLLTHKESTFKCSKCPKAFTLEANRKRHELLHTNEKPFACDLCSSRFKSKYLLTRHKRLHDKSRPYKCDHCDNVFLSKFEVQRHILIHTDLKPFSCDFCKIQFRRNDNLKRHVMHHHTKNTVDESTENSTESEDQRIPIAGPSTSGISTSKRKQLGVEEAKRTEKEDNTTEKVKNSTKPKKVSRTNSSSSSNKSSPKPSKSNVMNHAVPISIRPTNSKFVFVDDIPREEALLLNQQIEIKMHEQKSYCNFPGLTRKTDARLRNGRSRSNSNSTDTTSSVSNQEKRKTGSSGDEESRQKDVSYVHWRRRTAETLRSKWNKKLQKVEQKSP